MRLPRKENNIIDLEKTTELVDRFIESGGTYFDTAFTYNGVEDAIRKALIERHPRGSYTIATKINAQSAKSRVDAQNQLNTSIERLSVNYLDYYLLHGISNSNCHIYDKYGLWDYIKEAKQKGLIRHIGFSYHGNSELLDRLLSTHPEAEFVQLQINYLDWDNPNIQSRENYEVARKHGKPIIVMEPCKGGLLANPPRVAKTLFDKADPQKSYASWAIRYIASLKGIQTILSGMNNQSQIIDNFTSISLKNRLNDNELKLITEVRNAIYNNNLIQCTGCRYCIKTCSKAILIPEILSNYNQEHAFELSKEKAKDDYAYITRHGGKASECIQCHQCEKMCPQHLPVTELLKFCAEIYE